MPDQNRQISVQQLLERVVSIDVAEQVADKIEPFLKSIDGKMPVPLRISLENKVRSTLRSMQTQHGISDIAMDEVWTSIGITKDPVQ